MKKQIEYEIIVYSGDGDGDVYYFEIDEARESLQQLEVNQKAGHKNSYITIKKWDNKTDSVFEYGDGEYSFHYANLPQYIQKKIKAIIKTYKETTS